MTESPIRTWLSRPRILIATVVVLVGTGSAFYGYAVHQWRLAEQAVSESRWKDADEPLAFCLKVWPRNTPVHLLAARVARSLGDFARAESLLNRCAKLE